MTHWMSVKLAESERPIAGNETATILKSSMISDETSEAVRRTGNLSRCNDRSGPGSPL